MKNNFYTYLYSDPTDLVPFYVGKGQYDRHKVRYHIGTSNRLLHNKILKVGISKVLISFLAYQVPENEAFYWEQYYIAEYGRRDLGTGILCNLTDGGDGVRGPRLYKHTEETKRRLREINLGREFSLESRRKMSEVQKLLLSSRLRGTVGRFVSRRTAEDPSSTSSGLSKEHKEKLRDRMLGIKRSEETKRRMSESNRGKNLGRRTFLGKKHSQESIEKMKRTKREKFLLNRVV